MDVVVQDNQIYKLSNGSPLLAKVTGAGCLLGAVIASFLNKDNKVTIEMLIEAISIYNIASEQAEQNSKNNGPGSFMVELLNALYHIKYDHYLKMSNRQEV